jgi:hypothetical protein
MPIRRAMWRRRAPACAPAPKHAQCRRLAAGRAALNDDGTALTVGDVATLASKAPTATAQYFVGDNPAISIRVDRSDQGDAISIQETVEEVAAEMEALCPKGSARLIRTRAEAISGRLNILLDNALTGLGLVVLLLFLFLNARTAFWVAAGIPTALLAAIALMYVAGMTLNMISLFALIITLGIVVDDAIVVGEHADFRYRRYGEDPEASERRAQRMARRSFPRRSPRHRLLRAGGHRRAVRRPDRRHPLHRDRGAAGLAGGMLPDPAQPHGPRAGNIRERCIGTTCPPAW